MLCTNGGGLTVTMDWRFTVYLQLSICGLCMARPPSLLICIFFLGDTGDGDALLSPSPSTGGYWSQLIQHRLWTSWTVIGEPRLGVGGWELWLELAALLLSRPRLSSAVAAAASRVAVWRPWIPVMRMRKPRPADHTLLQLTRVKLYV